MQPLDDDAFASLEFFFKITKSISLPTISVMSRPSHAAPRGFMRLVIYDIAEIQNKFGDMMEDNLERIYGKKEGIITITERMEEKRPCFHHQPSKGSLDYMVTCVIIYNFLFAISLMTHYLMSDNISVHWKIKFCCQCQH